MPAGIRFRLQPCPPEKPKDGIDMDAFALRLFERMGWTTADYRALSIAEPQGNAYPA